MGDNYSTAESLSTIGLRRLAEFSSRLAHAVATGEDQSASVRHVRDILANALADSEFSIDCAEASIKTIAASANSVWTNPPLIENESQEYSVRLMYWPPKFSNSPHEHTFWTVTGVFSNALTFSTYRRRSTDTPQLELEKEIRAVRGEVGYILPPCIHRVANESSLPSISFHIFSGPKLTRGSYERGRTTWYASSGQPEPRILTVSHAVDALISVLVSFPSERCLDILDQAFYLPDLPTRLYCAKAIGRRDPKRAALRLLDLSKVCNAADSERMKRLANSLLQVHA
jgi:predicted metal-dependent enzyme (double-stranded beta helix superfamily)